MLRDVRGSSSHSLRKQLAGPMLLLNAQPTVLITLQSYRYQGELSICSAAARSILSDCPPRMSVSYEGRYVTVFTYLQLQFVHGVCGGSAR